MLISPALLFDSIIRNSVCTPAKLPCRRWRWYTIIKSMLHITCILGLLKMRFRCILKESVLHYGTEKAGQIIIACCVLHNICISGRIEYEMELDDDENVEDLDENGNLYNEVNVFREGQERRENIIHLYFNR
jgi:hypothetical protein